MVLDGSRPDLVVLKFQEHASSGYVWQFGDLVDAGLEIVEDGRAAKGSKQHVGGVVFRTVIAESQEERGASGHVRLREVRPWQAKGEPLPSLSTRRRFIMYLGISTQKSCARAWVAAASAVIARGKES